MKMERKNKAFWLIAFLSLGILIPKVMAQNTGQGKSSLTNVSTSKLSLYYFDYFKDFSEINLGIKETKQFNFAKPTIVYASSFTKEPFLIFPNDIVKVLLEKNGKYLLSGISESRTAEIMMLKNISYSIDKVDNPKDMLNAMNKDGQLLANPQKRDNELENKYKQELALLYNYSKQHNISLNTVKLVKDYYYYEFLKERSKHLNLRSFRERKLPEAYRDSLIALKQYLNCDSCLDIDNYGDFAFNYLVYLESERPKEGIMQYICDTFKGGTRDFMLFSLMKGYSNRNKALLISNYETFTKAVVNNEYKKYMSNLYEFAQLEDDNSNRDLADDNNNRLSLANLIRKHPNKVIYIDFWASWCEPCIAEMPSSIATQKKLSGKDIVFVYFSLDRNKNAWQTSTKANKINPVNSYLLIGDYASSIAKQFKIKEIPRYILIGKDGKVFNDDAPRPSDSKLIPIVNQLLTK